MITYDCCCNFLKNLYVMIVSEHFIQFYVINYQNFMQIVNFNNDENV